MVLFFLTNLYPCPLYSSHSKQLKKVQFRLNPSMEQLIHLALKVLKGVPTLKAAFTAGMQDSKAPPTEKQMKEKTEKLAQVTLAAQMLQFLRKHLVPCFAENINQNWSKL